MGFWDWLIKPKLSNLARDCFNKYQDWFVQLKPCDETLDVTLKVRIRAFGSEKVKQATWDKDWRSKHPLWGKAAAGVSVSSKIPEIWCDLRMSKQGLVLPLGVLAHEIHHVLKLQDGRMCDPDSLINEDIY